MKPTRDPQSLASIALATGYRTGQQDLVADFYVPCLSAAVRYDRAAGYFHSTLYVLIGVAMSDFARRGGAMRLVCSPYLYDEDIRAIREGAQRRDADAAFRESLDSCLGAPVDQPVASLLATLVAAGALDVRLAFRPGSTGIFHDKVGVFADSQGHRVSFVGSANETYSAWHPSANHEGFEVFGEWTSPDARERVERHQAYFANLWNGLEDGVAVAPLSQVSQELIRRFADPAGIDAAADKVRAVVQDLPAHIAPARVQNRVILQQHQIEAVNNWESMGHRGIFKHATGAGKTVAALEGIRRWILSGKPALVVVPSDLLALQWKREADAYLTGVDYSLLQAGGLESDPKWRSLITDASRDEIAMGPRLTIATMQTASTDDFMRRLQGGPHLLLVADEVHRIGSPQFSRILTTTAGGRLGLSATPERYGDPAGTISIYTFFGGIVPPEISLSDAIRAGRLVPYDYFVHEVMLDGEEQSEWNEITQEIRAVYARIKSSDREVSFSDHLKFLLIRRARILKHAAGKVSLAVSVMENFYANGDRWLVYCDDRRQLGAIVAALTSRGLPAFEYHSAMTGSKEATLDYFSHDGGIVVAIRCLDEGVDIPIVNKALVLASSTNPREFVQRRGRVLRRAPDKTSAEVHDALVLPNSSLGTQDPVARAIAGIEIRRAVHFADTARNWAVRSQLIHIAGTFGLDLSIPASAEGLSLEEEDSLEPQ